MIKIPNETADTEDIAPSYFIIEAIEEGAKKIVPNGSMSFQNDPRGTVHLALKYSWHQLQKKTEPDDLNLLSIREPEQNVVRAQVGEQLRNNQIPLTSTTSLTNVARSIVIRNMVQRVLAQNPHSHILTEVEKRGIVASQTDINEALMHITKMTSIDAAMRAVNNVEENSDFRKAEPDQIETALEWAKNGVARARESIHQIPSIAQGLLHRTLAFGAKHFNEVSKVAVAPPERSEPLTARALRTLREKMTTLLEEQSNAPEGFRTKMARLITGKEPIPRPTFGVGETEGADWAEQCLEKIATLIDAIRKSMPHVRPSQLRIILGFAALNHGNSHNNGIALEAKNTPVTGETGLLRGDETSLYGKNSADLMEWHTEKAREGQIASISDWIDRVQAMAHLPTPVIDMVTREIRTHLLSTRNTPMTEDILGVMIQESCARNATNVAQDKSEGFERANEMLQRIEAAKRLAIQQAGGIDPSRAGAKIVEAFTHLPENGNPNDVLVEMNKSGIFA